MKKSILSICVCLGFTLSATRSNGQQTPSQSTCDILATNLKQNDLLFGSDQRQFEELQKFISQQQFSDYTTASNSTFGLGISVPSYVDLTLNTTSDSKSWQTNWNTFKSMTYEGRASSAIVQKATHTAAEGAIKTISDCAIALANSSASGLFVTLANVTPNRDAFTLNVTRATKGTSRWKLKGLTIVPQGTDKDLRCMNGTDNLLLVSESHPREEDGSIAIACSKNPTTNLGVSISTDQGAPITFTIPSLNDEWAALDERLKRIEAATVPTGTIAYFKSQACPAGWAIATSLKGLYVVGALPGQQIGISPAGITPLAELENRPTGDHAHDLKGWAFTGAGTNDGNFGVQTGAPGLERKGGQQTGSVVSGIPGTNAPYIELLPCEKR